jgi:ribonuclease P/MRP protein subunit POP5
MDAVPVKGGKSCVYRVVRASGTIRKAEEEAIRLAREMILRAKRELGDQSGAALDRILGKGDSKAVIVDSEVLMLDASEDEEYSEDDG